MSQVAVQPFAGNFVGAPAASTFAFGVRHSDTFWFRGVLTDVKTTLRGDGGGLVLEGSAGVDSISVVEPEAMRASVLGPEFFDTENHPRLLFGSTEIRLAEDGSLELDGELTMKGTSRPVSATGSYSAPRMSGFGEIAGLDLHTTLDRRDFGFDWQVPLPNGGDSVGWDVQVDIDLLLVREAADADA
ncbi:MAG: YceI family protein [Actinobacteria bacterium]|nr:YceI family protein [Actinomycetota bacterium]